MQNPANSAATMSHVHDVKLSLLRKSDTAALIPGYTKANIADGLYIYRPSTSPVEQISRRRIGGMACNITDPPNATTKARKITSRSRPPNISTAVGYLVTGKGRRSSSIDHSRNTRTKKAAAATFFA